MSEVGFEGDEPPEAKTFGEKIECAPYEKFFLDDAKESEELIQRCKDYRKLYLLRYSKRIIGARMIRKYKMLANFFTAPDINNKCVYRCVYRTLHSMSVPHIAHRRHDFCNLYKFLQELSKLEEEVGQSQWNYYYISSPMLYGADVVCMKMFTTLISTLLEDVFNAVMRRDWLQVSMEISKIVIHESQSSFENFYMVYSTKAYSLYFSKFYLLSLQIILETARRSTEVTAQKYSRALNKFMKAHLCAGQNMDNSEFYVVHYMIFQLANLRFEMAENAASFNTNKQNIEWSRCLSVYKYCVEYEKYVDDLLAAKNSRTRRSSRAHSHEVSHEISSFFSTALSAFVNGSGSLAALSRQTADVRAGGVGGVCADDCVGLLPVFVHLAKVLGETDVLEETLTDACISNLLLLERAHAVLVRFGLDPIAGKLLSRAFVSLPAEQLACHDFIIDIVEQRSLDPSCFGPLDEVVSMNLSCLFNFLDYGRNRANERAWPLLYANLKYVAAELDAFVHSHWATRKSWWHRFHFAVTLRGVPRKTRAAVFAMLKHVEIPG